MFHYSEISGFPKLGNISSITVRKYFPHHLLGQGTSACLPHTSCAEGNPGAYSKEPMKTLASPVGPTAESMKLTSSST